MLGEAVKKTFKVVTVEGMGSTRASVREVRHGDSLNGLNVVAVLDGELCRDKCEWCTRLAERIQSRVVRLGA